MRVVVAMSGGVDSSVVAGLLREAGHEVSGVTFRMFPPIDPGKQDAVRDAQTVCARLGLAHQVVDLGDRFEERVLRRSWQEYSRGRTPNPCVLCNPGVKFQALLEVAQATGAERVATGHYARIEQEADGNPRLLRGKNLRKEQSYFLVGLTDDQLKHSWFPLGDMTKEEVRAQARRMGLANSERPESQDACFSALSTDGFAEALRKRFGEASRTGAIVGPGGESLGRHAGLHQYTVGQRRGLGVALGRPAWVTRLEPGQAQVHLSDREEDLWDSQLWVEQARFLPGVEPARLHRARVQIRYRHQAVPAKIQLDADGRLGVHFDEVVRAITPGQAAVLYDEEGNERVLGGGTIGAAPEGAHHG